MNPDHASESDTIHIPFSHDTSDALVNAWQVQINGFSVKNSNLTNTALSNVYATFELGVGFSLPKQLYHQTLASLGAEEGQHFWSPFPGYDCRRWGSMPDLILTFAGNDIVLTKEDYSWRGSFAAEPWRCYVFLQRERYNWEPITIGVELLRKFYLVFDIDNYELRRAYAKFDAGLRAMLIVFSNLPDYALSQTLLST